MIGELTREQEVGRNEEWIFYKSGLTESAVNWAKEKWKIDWIDVCVVREIVYGEKTAFLFDVPKANPEAAYLIIDKRDNSPIYENTTYESILYWIDFIGISKQFNGKKTKKTIKKQHV